MYLCVVNFHGSYMWNNGVSNCDTSNVLVKTSRPRIAQCLCRCYAPSKIKNSAACNSSWSCICSGISLCVQYVCRGVLAKTTLRWHVWALRRWGDTNFEIRITCLTGPSPIGQYVCRFLYHWSLAELIYEHRMVVVTVKVAVVVKGMVN